jgi:hypothetical protein
VNGVVERLQWRRIEDFRRSLGVGTDDPKRLASGASADIDGRNRSAMVDLAYDHDGRNLSRVGGAKWGSNSAYVGGFGRTTRKKFLLHGHPRTPRTAPKAFTPWRSGDRGAYRPPGEMGSSGAGSGPDDGAPWSLADGPGSTTAARTPCPPQGRLLHKVVPSPTRADSR